MSVGHACWESAQPVGSGNIWVVSLPTRGLSCRQICFASRAIIQTYVLRSEQTIRSTGESTSWSRNYPNIIAPYGLSTFPTLVSNGQPLHIYLSMIPTTIFLNSDI